MIFVYFVVASLLAKRAFQTTLLGDETALVFTDYSTILTFLKSVVNIFSCSRLCPDLLFVGGELINLDDTRKRTSASGSKDLP